MFSKTILLVFKTFEKLTAYGLHQAVCYVNGTFKLSVFSLTIHGSDLVELDLFLC